MHYNALQCIAMVLLHFCKLKIPCKGESMKHGRVIFLLFAAALMLLPAGAAGQRKVLLEMFSGTW